MDAFSFIDQIAVTTELIVETIRQAGPVLSVFLFFAFIAIILISGIIYVLEKGVFTVNSDYPLGQYLRLNLEQNGLQVSPYRSACVGIYWTIITCTLLTVRTSLSRPCCFILYNINNTIRGVISYLSFPPSSISVYSHFYFYYHFYFYFHLQILSPSNSRHHCRLRRRLSYNNSGSGPSLYVCVTRYGHTIY